MLNPDSDVLLVQYNGQDDWALPGGNIEEGEDSDERVVTEVEEETGVNIGDLLLHVGRYAGTMAVHEVYMAPGSGELRPTHRAIQDAIWWDGVQPLQVQPHVNAILEMIDSIEVQDSDVHVDVQDTNLPIEETGDSLWQTESVPILEPQAAPPVYEPQASPEEQTLSSNTDRSPTWALILATVWAWTVVVASWLADRLIDVMLITRSNERRIRPTKRVTWRKGLKQELMKRQDKTCVYCGYRRIARSLDIDHMIPVVDGGSNDPSNLQVICRPCNQRKGSQTDAEFRERYSRLVPATPLTSPNRRISQAEFREETRRTSQSTRVRERRRTRYISPREKIVSGCLIAGVVVTVLVAYGLSLLGAEGLLMAIPALVVGGAVGLGLWLRADVTGATLEDEG